MKIRASGYAPVRDALVPLFSFAWRLLLILSLARALLVIWQWDRVAGANMLASIFVEGFRFDVALLGVFLLPAALLFPFLVSNRFLIPAWRIFLRVYLPAALLVAFLMELSTPFFINRFDLRPNILFVEYLAHPSEMFAVFWTAYKLPMIFAAFAAGIITVITTRAFARMSSNIRPTGFAAAFAVAPFLLLACLGMVRSSVDREAVNPATVALSNDSLVNELALNSAYTLGYAIYETRHEAQGGFRYGEMHDDAVVSVVRGGMDVDSWDFTSTTQPTLHIQRPTNIDSERLNLVIIVVEGLGAELVGSLGGMDLTPNLDHYAEQGIWLSNLYATGTRSVRGLEAVVSGFSPTPARSVVKLQKSQRNFFTLAEVLGREAYDTSFIYGGESQFDNMRQFFGNNGFDRIIDRKDYASPVFTGSWGVSDEDLFDRAHDEFAAQQGRPFFSLVFTSSSQPPYQYPDERIEQVDDTKNSANNAAKYADYALGRFLDKARDSNYWDDTVFLIVADHGSRVYGSEIVPVEQFHIPGLILGSAVKPEVIDRVTSQIDLAPTMLSLIGVTAEHPMIGRDLSKSAGLKAPGRAIMQFNGVQAYLEGERVAVLRRNQPVTQFLYRDGHLVDDGEYSLELTKRAVAHSRWSSMAYDRSLHQLPELENVVVSRLDR